MKKNVQHRINPGVVAKAKADADYFFRLNAKKKKRLFILVASLVTICVMILMGVGCPGSSEEITPVTTIPALNDRVGALEAWKLIVDGRLATMATNDYVDSKVASVSTPDLSGLTDRIGTLESRISALELWMETFEEGGGGGGTGTVAETTSWTFTSLFLDDGVATAQLADGITNKVIEKSYTDVDGDCLVWYVSSYPRRIEESDLYEITLTLYNDDSAITRDITFTNVYFEFTLSPAEYTPIDQESTYLDSDSVPYLYWDADFTMKTREGIEICRRIVFVSEAYSGVITSGSTLTLKLVLELYY